MCKVNVHAEKMTQVQLKGFDSSAEKPVNRKRTNTTSSGGGEKRTANKVGMKKEWIMSDEARLEKKQRVEENRERRMADAMARAEAIDDDDNTQNETDVAERMRQRAAQTQELGTQYDSGRVENRVDEMPTTLRQQEDLYSINVSQEHSTVPIVVPPLLEAGSTAVAQSLADVSSTTTAAPTMDVDPATTMSSSGFIPPAVESGLLVMPASNTVDPSFMAQAQLAAAAAAQVQVQAAINQHQIAAAVAQQVAAHIVNAAPVAAPVPAPIPSALNQVLVKLIENNPPRVNCTCQCTCGRYPPGCAIVDEVTKDLLAAGNNTSNAEPATREEAKLESAEDFHMNGLLPSDESSVQWLNACAPTVDPSAVVVSCASFWNCMQQVAEEYEIAM
ncbi:unnamed protein product [Heligmosomoides polygyrus]|uniref:BZIP domain-containing protein n=1 Tax=Heligmosomoides polygyrus TaxID=6339 RepID=A0A3P7ZLZ8_HELPZ|nr:unnamed protein product [Heligmosomoides polygyrus]